MSDVVIAPGQVWRSRDKREHERTATIESVDEQWVHVRSVRRSRVRRHLFVKAYELVTGPGWPAPTYEEG